MRKVSLSFVEAAFIIVFLGCSPELMLLEEAQILFQPEPSKALDPLPFRLLSDPKMEDLLGCSPFHLPSMI